MCAHIAPGTDQNPVGGSAGISRRRSAALFLLITAA